MATYALCAGLKSPYTVFHKLLDFTEGFIPPMNQRTQYFIQILEKIGTPLLSAIITQPSANDDAQDEARKMAGLLSKSVEISISFGQMIDINALGEDSDRVRVAMMALAANLVGENYKSKGQPPGEAENKRMVAALQAALTFSENFSASPENTKALGTLEANGQASDIHQTNVQYIQAFVPVISAITEFSFGHKEPKLMTEIASKLISKSEDMARALSANSNEPAPTRVALGILRALATLYADCHRMETAHVMKMSEDERARQAQDSGALALDAIWQAFDLRVTVLEALTQNILAGSGATTSTRASAKPVTPPPAEAAPPPPPPPIFQAPSQTEAAAPPPATPPAQPAGNPMSMFSKKRESEAPKTETPPPVSEPEKPDAAPNGNPMAFFKTPKKDDE